MSVQMFSLSRPVFVQEYNASNNVVDVNEDIQLTDDQIHKLNLQFSEFIHILYPDGEVEVVDVNIDNKCLTVILGSTIIFTEDQHEHIEQEFDRWFVDELAPTWQLDILPHQKWLMLGYRPII